MNAILYESELGLLQFARERGYLKPSQADLPPMELFCSIIVQNAGARYARLQDRMYGKPFLVLFNDPVLGTTLALPWTELSTHAVKAKIREAREKFGASPTAPPLRCPVRAFVAARVAFIKGHPLYLGISQWGPRLGPWVWLCFFAGLVVLPWLIVKVFP